MWRRAGALFVASAGALLLWGCSTKPDYVAVNEPWRKVEEQSCVASGLVRESRFVQSRSALGGPGGGACSVEHPFDMAGTADGRVVLRPSATLRCQMIPAVERWITQTVQPAAVGLLGAPVVEIKVAASYACRPRNGIAGGRLSEHGVANALDVSAFLLADGTSVDVKHGWRDAGGRQQAFLRQVHGGACREFTTVLGPDADRFHHDHFHMDLARHGRDGTYRVCK